MRVLIGRGLDHNGHEFISQVSLFNFEDPVLKTGANGGEVPPVPIPNTEVKLTSVENTWLETAWEDRAAPVQTVRKLVLYGLFDVYSSESKRSLIWARAKEEDIPP